MADHFDEQQLLSRWWSILTFDPEGPDAPVLLARELCRQYELLYGPASADMKVALHDLASSVIAVRRTRL